jgi:hypothetical protein
MRLSVAFALALLPVPFLFVACGDDEAPANGATAASTSSGSGGSGGGGGEAPSLCTTTALTLPEVAFFSDVSDASGIRDENFVESPPVTIPINDHSRLAFADLDGDGYDDIVAHSLFPNPEAGIPFDHLVFMNNQDGTFRNASDESGLRAVQAGFFIFGDVDNDGDQDVFAGLDIPLAGETNQVLLNDGTGHFTKLEGSGIEGASNATYVGSAAFADLNRDGKLDVYLANGQTSYAVADALYFGHGDGTFEKVTTASLTGGNPKQPSNGVVICDYDDDGDLDIFVSTYSVSTLHGHNLLWENDGTGVFTDVAEARGFAALGTGNYWLSSTGHGTDIEPDADASTFVGSNGFGIDCEDITGDGLDDIYLATISHPVGSDYDRKWSDPTQLLVNQGAAGAFAFSNEFLARGLPFNEGDIDAATLDFDNDGRLDLSVTRDNKYESGYTEDEQKSWFGLFRQGGDGKFTSLGLASGINDPEDTGLERMKAGQNHAYADIDRDGDLDLLVGGRDHGGGRANYLFRNDIGSKNTWLAVRLVGDGVAINRDAIGATVTLKFPSWNVKRVVKSSRGTYSSADTRTLHFGLGDLGCDFTMDVRWPDGKVTTVDGDAIPSNTFVTVDYDAGLILP